MSTAQQRFSSIWEAHHGEVARFVARRLPSHEDGSDVVSEVFLTVWRRISEVPSSPEHLRSWLFGVARKAVANRIRSDRRRADLQTKLCATSVPPAEPADAQGGTAATNLVAAFNKLSAKDREAIALVTWENLAPREAAEVLGLSAARFRVRLHRAKTRLRSHAGEKKAATMESPAEFRPSPTTLREKS